MVELAILSVFMLVLGIGRLIADYVFPHIGPLQRWIDSLPMMDDEEEELMMAESSDILSKEEAA